MMGSKVMTMENAVREYVKDGDLLYEGGFTIRIIHSAMHEIIRQGKKDLMLCGSGGWAEEVDMAVAAHCVRGLMNPYWGLFEVGLSRVATRAINNNDVTISDYTNLSAPLRTLAGALGVPFIATREALGSDLLKYADPNEVKVAECPFTGEKVVLYKALNPDVAIVHAQQADEEGNTQMFGLIAGDDWGARASSRAIVTVERIVTREEIGRDPNRTVIPGDFVSAVVYEPFGAHPSGVTGYYKEDVPFRQLYASMAKSETGLKEFMDEWVYGICDRKEYVEKYISKFGYRAFQALTVEPFYTYPINIGGC